MKTVLTIIIFILSSFLAFSQSGHWDSIPTKGNPGYRHDHGMSPIGDKQVLVFGGAMASAKNDTWIFDLKDSSWTRIETNHTPTPREACEMLQISKNKVMMHGGMDNWIMKNDTWIFDLDSMDWRQVITDSAGPATTRFGMARYNDSLVFLTEGGTTLGWGSIWYYNIINEEWHLQWGFIPEDKTEPNVTQIADNIVLVCGGYNSHKGLLNGLFLWEYDSLKTDRKKGIAGYSTDIQHINNGLCLIFSGHLKTGQFNTDTWLYDYKNDTWTLLNIDYSPSSRLRHKLALIDTNKVITYGGYVNSKDVWIFTLDSLTDIKDKDKEGLQVYYSNSNIIIARNSEYLDLTVELYNIFGQHITTHKYQTTQEITIPNMKLSSGCYFVRLIHKNKSNIRKLIIN